MALAKLTPIHQQAKMTSILKDLIQEYNNISMILTITIDKKVD
jgi:hypothetical protein